MRPDARLPLVLSFVSLALACTPSEPTMDSFGFTTMGDGDGDAETRSGDGDGDGDGDPNPNCGNGTVESGEECDLGPANAPDGQCTPDCLIATCGDGYHNPDFEECDDGNTNNMDDCVANCLIATCGDGF